MTRHSDLGGDQEPAPWVEIAPEGVLEPALVKRLEAHGIGVDQKRLLSLLVADPVTTDFLKVETEHEGASGGLIGYVIPRTRIFVNRPRALDLGWDAITAAAVFALTGSASVSVAAQVFQRAVRLMRVLSEDEADLAIVLAALSSGRPYDVFVPLERVAAAYEEDQDRVLPLLEGMRKRGIASDDGDGWRLVR